MIDQEKAFEKLSKLKVGALFMEMGTGKTKVALDLIASKKEKVDYILWICPFSIKSEILVEKNKWHPELEIEVVGCESIGSSDRIYIELLNKVENSTTFRTSRIIQRQGFFKKLGIKKVSSKCRQTNFRIL